MHIEIGLLRTARTFSAFRTLATTGRWTAFASTLTTLATTGFTSASSTLTSTATAGRRPLRQHFFRRQLAIAVLVECLEDSRGIGDLLGGQFTVLVSVEGSCDRDKPHGLCPAYPPRSLGRPALTTAPLSAFTTARSTLASTRRRSTLAWAGSFITSTGSWTVCFIRPVLSQRNAQSHDDQSRGQHGQPVCFLHDGFLGSEVGQRPRSNVAGSVPDTHETPDSCRGIDKCEKFSGRMMSQVRIDHHLHELPEAHIWCPAQLGPGLGRIA